MNPTLSVLIGLALFTGIPTFAYANSDVENAAYKASQSNYRDSSANYLQEFGIQSTPANIH